MREHRPGGIGILSLVMLILFVAATPARPQDAAAPYPKMAPIGQYLMDRTAEIALARSAAPDSVSGGATVLVLGREGYQTAVKGKNGFVCWVGRAWSGAFDWDEFWNPKVRAADCMNAAAAGSILPALSLRARMVMAGRSKAEIESAIEEAYEKKQLPGLESGAMDYMMSKSSYLTDQGGHNLPHVMFYTPAKGGDDSAFGAEGSPVMSSPYWFFSPKEQSRAKGLPPILVVLVAVPAWSDGTSAGGHHE